MAKQKFYAIAKGYQTGIFTSWNEAKNLIDGYKGAIYKSFPTREEAEVWLKNPKYGQGGKKPSTVSKKKIQDFSKTDGIVIFSDGGSINNPGPGGYGAIIIKNGKELELSQGYRLTTNNRMELRGVISALTEVRGTKEKIKVYTDSKYVVDAINKGWTKNWQRNGWLKADKTPVLNRDLWELLVDLNRELDVEFNWVKGHAGNHYNERCDRLAVSSARSGDHQVDHGFESNKR